MSLEGVSEIDLLRSSDSILKRKPWRLAARPNQIAPPGDWGTWAIISGRGFGKTRSGTEWIHERAHDPMAVLGISSPTTDDIKKVLVFGPAGIMATSEPGFRPEYHSADREGANYLVWPNGVHGFLYSAEEPDRCRGPAHCFVADTLVAMANGTEKRIADVRRGDSVLTRAGAKKVTNTEEIKNKEAWALRFSDGRVIIGTPDHRIWRDGKGYCQLKDLKVGQRCVILASPSTVGSGTEGQAGTSSPDCSCIGRSGLPSTVQSLTETRFTTSMATRKTTESKTSRCSHTESTAVCTRESTSSLLVSGNGRSRVRSNQIGAPERSAARSILSVPSAAVFSTAAPSIQQGFAPENASTRPSLGHSGKKTGFAVGAGLDTPPRGHPSAIAAGGATRLLRQNDPALSLNESCPVHGVARNSNPSAAMQDSIDVNVPLLTTTNIVEVGRFRVTASVYDIEVEDPHEFFANGVLVHNSDFYGDEIAAYPKLEEMLYNIRMGLRIKTKGNNEIPRLMLTSTPRPLPEIRALFADPNCIVVTGSTWDNEANLPAAFIADMHRRFDDTRIGAQELEGKVLEEAGALFTQATLDRTRVAVLPQMLAWGVGVDPSAGDKEGNDEQGIGDGGLGADDHLYITGDATVKLPPAGWGHATVKTAIAHTPWATVWVEKNTGGQMAAHVVNIAAEKAGVQGLKVEEVVAKTGKHVRAEMLSALFEQGRAHILGKLDDSGMVVQDEWSKELEKELLGFTAIGYAGKKSPNRADGCVWMANGLMGRGSWAAGEVDESLEEFV